MKTYSRFLVGTLLTPLIWAQGNTGQAPVSRYAGTVREVTTSSGTRSRESLTYSWNYRLERTDTVVFDKPVPGRQYPFPEWTGQATTAVDANFTATQTDASCVTTWKLERASAEPIPQAPPQLTMNFGAQMARYRFTIPILGTMDVRYKRDCKGEILENVNRTVLMSFAADIDGALSAGKLEIEGQKKFKVPSPGSFDEFDVTIDYRLVPDEELEVIVEPDGYDTWRPAGGADEKTAGNDISITARLQRKGGGEPSEKAERFIFQLTEVSTEPGVSINYPPPEDAQRDPDLQFEKAPNAVMKLNWISHKRVETPPGQYTTAAAVVSSFDWGAFGKMRVTVNLLNGDTITGHLAGDRNRTEVLLPKRTEPSAIADVWKSKRRVAGLKDSDDNEDSPLGDGHRGDGFTLYEEYRGFHEKGSHQECVPTIKDFFIRNDSGGFLAGILLFAERTGLAVHHQLTLAEISAGRVVNTNYGRRDLHLVDQHAVVVLQNAARDGSSEAIRVDGTGEPGSPWRFSHVELSGIFPNRQAANSAPSYADATLAHELLHTVNVWHHGDTDLGTKWLARGEKDGQWVIVEGGRTVVRLMGEDQVEIPAGTSFLNTPKQFWIAVEQGQHSGVELCLMRYDTAQFYIRKSKEDIRFEAKPPEVFGTELCDTVVGSGVNASYQPFPRPRYGDAAPNRGSCRFQICVNDLYSHPSR